MHYTSYCHSEECNGEEFYRFFKIPHCVQNDNVNMSAFCNSRPNIKFY